jgi:hypothetical protein
MTVARWRNQGRRPLEREMRHPLEIARASLDDAVPLLGDPMTMVETLIPKRNCKLSGPPTLETLQSQIRKIVRKRLSLSRLELVHGCLQTLAGRSRWKPGCLLAK